MLGREDMKTERLSRAGAQFQFCAALAFVLAGGPIAWSDEGQAVVRAIHGSAAHLVDGAWRPLKVGKVLKSGSKVKTGEGATVDLYLDQNGPVVRITENTTFGLDVLKFETNTGSALVIHTELHLPIGRILASLRPLAKESKYNVKIPGGVVEFRGGDIEVTADGKVRVVGPPATLVRTVSGKQPQVEVINPVSPKIKPAYPTP